MYWAHFFANQNQACRNGCVSAVEVLLRCKGEVNKNDRYHIIMISRTNEVENTLIPCIFGSWRHICHSVVRLIFVPMTRSWIFQCFICRWGATPLQDAISAGHQQTASIIITAGGIMSGSYGKTQVFQAASRGDVKALRTLFDYAGHKVDIFSLDIIYIYIYI